MRYSQCNDHFIQSVIVKQMTSTDSLTRVLHPRYEQFFEAPTIQNVQHQRFADIEREKTKKLGSHQ